MATYNLVVRIIEAKDLRAADKGGTSDPYVKIRVGSNQTKTKVVKKCLNPRWDETFRFKIANPKTSKVVLEVFDKDKWTPDDPLGTISLPLLKLEQGIEKNEWHNLTGTNRGQIHVGLKAEDFGLPPGSAQQEMAQGQGQMGYGAYGEQKQINTPGGAYPSASQHGAPQSGYFPPSADTYTSGYSPLAANQQYPPVPGGSAYPSNAAYSQPQPGPAPGGSAYPSNAAQFGGPPMDHQANPYGAPPMNQPMNPPVNQPNALYGSSSLYGNAPQAGGSYGTPGNAGSSLYSSTQSYPPQNQYY